MVSLSLLYHRAVAFFFLALYLGDTTAFKFGSRIKGKASNKKSALQVLGAVRQSSSHIYQILQQAANYLSQKTSRLSLDQPQTTDQESTCKRSNSSAQIKQHHLATDSLPQPCSILASHLKDRNTTQKSLSMAHGPYMQPSSRFVRSRAPTQLYLHCVRLWLSATSRAHCTDQTHPSFLTHNSAIAYKPWSRDPNGGSATAIAGRMRW